MPRTAGKVPSYCRHKASGQAVVRINGRDEYLGPYGSPESHSRYEQLIAEWRVQQLERAERQAAAPSLAAYNLTVSEVVQRYRHFAEAYYTKGGQPTKELKQMRYALRPMRQLYGDTPAREFGPLKLKAVRQRMIDDQRLSRGVINQRIKRIKRFFKWAVSEELVPPSVAQGLATVAGLRKGRTTARETPPVQPVDDVWVELVVPHLSPPVAAMVQLQRLTGMRPCEVVLLRGCDIDRTNDVWIYEPLEHKSEWRGHSRLVPLGPQAQQILAPFLTADAERYVFSPRDAEAWRNERRAQQRNPDRKTKIYPCELRARERRKAAARKRVSKRPKRERYDVDSYRRAITYAIRKVNAERAQQDLGPMPKWCPLQLRHSRATEIRRDFGIEAAQVSLGHAHADVTQVYAERNLQLAIEIAKKTG